MTIYKMTIYFIVIICFMNVSRLETILPRFITQMYILKNRFVTTTSSEREHNVFEYLIACDCDYDSTL